MITRIERELAPDLSAPTERATALTEALKGTEIVLNAMTWVIEEFRADGYAVNAYVSDRSGHRYASPISVQRISSALRPAPKRATPKGKIRKAARR